MENVSITHCVKCVVPGGGGGNSTYERGGDACRLA